MRRWRCAPTSARPGTLGWSRVAAGSPSAAVLDRIAQALTLTEVEREHLFLLGLGRPPEVRFRGSDAITPRLQRLLDVLSYSPAIIRTATWDVVAWNRAAAAVLTDYGALSPDQRNVLRHDLLRSPRPRGAMRIGNPWPASS